LSLEKLNSLPLNTVKPKFIAILAFFGTAASFIDTIGSTGSHFVLSVCLEVNSTSYSPWS